MLLILSVSCLDSITSKCEIGLFAGATYNIQFRLLNFTKKEVVATIKWLFWPLSFVSHI